MPASTSLWPRIEPLLAHIEHPSRYIGGEVNATVADPNANYRAVFLYPDTYELGQSNQAVAILYAIANTLPGVSAERAYLPWLDMAEQMRTHDIPLYSLESFSPVRDFDLFGITLPHELCATNVCEALGMAGIPLHASERADGDPVVLGGGPCTYNPEPFAAFFDAFLIGEGEEALPEIIGALQAAKARGASRAQALEELARIEGVYVPGIWHATHQPALINKRIVRDFDGTPVITAPIVPFAEVAQDRFTVEVLRGCSRGCRFCQAGMTYRPVRERSADNIVAAVAQGLANTGFDEVSLVSLSTTDHSQIAEVLRRLNSMLAGTGVGLSLPSQRLDAFGVEMAQLVAGEKKAGLTFAPEAATQRLRDVINKGVTEDDLARAVQEAFAAGWRRCKLYFMIGLPGETDEDVCAIAELANRTQAVAREAVPVDQRGNVRIGVSVALFVPKPGTPFQWCGQITREEAARRIALLRGVRLARGVTLHWHDPATSMLEAVVARGSRDCAQLIEGAWRHGAHFDAWTEVFDMDAWEAAAAELGVSLQQLASRRLEPGVALPWAHISSGVEEDYLFDEYERALHGQTTPDCSFTACTDCGACQNLGAAIRLGGHERA